MPYDEIYLNSIMRIMRAASSEPLWLRDVHACIFAENPGLHITT